MRSSPLRNGTGISWGFTATRRASILTGIWCDAAAAAAAAVAAAAAFIYCRVVSESFYFFGGNVDKVLLLPFIFLLVFFSSRYKVQPS